MAEIKWTEGQLQAINEKGKNILVSAAAGSGKTAVLVERVLRMLKDPDDPADISSFIIITFTRAAAAQMKEKIRKGICKALESDPDNDHLKMQLQKVRTARICTIDSLCCDIVRENFQYVNIDPGFRIADESEVDALRQEILSEILEEQYSQGSEGFIKLIEYYIDKNDKSVEEIILDLYRFSRSHPEPERWIMDSVSAYIKAGDLGVDYNEGEGLWLKRLGSNVRTKIGALKEYADIGIKICDMNYGPDKYRDCFEKISILLKRLYADDATFDFIGESLRLFIADWERLPAIRGNDTDKNLKESAKLIYSDIKDNLKELEDKYFRVNLEEAYQSMADCADVVKTIADITLTFAKCFFNAKMDRNIAEFDDISHFALSILIKSDENGHIERSDDGMCIYSAVADKMASQIREIIVDEYQDTNLVQEYIIRALSSERFNRPNIFMVGDIKQSIYGFRQADPAIFAAKYDEYAVPSQDHLRILLNANFRSRREILDLTNDLFSCIMIRDIGGIDYNDGHALVCGAQYPESENDINVPEIIFIDENGKKAAREKEAYVIAKKIEELVSCGTVTDADTGDARGICYGDIAILTRKNDNSELLKELDNRSIPYIKTSGKGFFDTFEIRLLTNLLAIIDNPYQDIPFTAVITSPIVGIDSNEVADIKVEYKDEPFSMYSACRSYGKSKCLDRFIARLDDYREKNKYMDIRGLLDYIISDSAIDGIVMSMNGGEIREANIESFKSIARIFSKTTGGGLFSFLRFINRLRQNGTDIKGVVRQAALQAVHVMTIHGSKGLEFPVVILAHAGDLYNSKDTKKSIITDKELGIGIEFRDPQRRSKCPTLLMNVIKDSKKTDMYAEELRLLYVALTRAKEKLIITGYLPGRESLDSFVQSCRSEMYRGENKMNCIGIMSAGSYLKAFCNALYAHPDSYPLRNIEDADQTGVLTPSFKSHYRFIIQNDIEIEEGRIEEIISAAELKAAIDDMLNQVPKYKKEISDLQDRYEKEYKYRSSTQKSIKITASQLEEHEKNDDQALKIPNNTYNADPGESDKPNKDGILHGADRGTAYHKMFELLKYDEIEAAWLDEAYRPADHSKAKYSDAEYISVLDSKINDMLDEFCKAGFITKEARETIEAKKIRRFLISDVGKRMKAAYDRGDLYREQQFVMGRQDSEGDEILVQGIIDAFFKEDGKAVVVDYKTDKGKTDEEFVKTYRNQLNAYADAIEAATGLKVKEKIIYSVEKGHPIYL